MYNSSTDLISNELPASSTRPIYDIFKSTTQIYKKIIEEDMYDSELCSNLRGLILNFVIQKHFEPKYIPKSFPFKTKISLKGRHKIVELRKGNILLTINKATKGYLPTTAVYKEQYSAWNFGLSPQFQLRFDVDSNPVKIVNEQYYGIITYSLKDFKYDYLDIIIPDSSFKEILDTTSLIPALEVVEPEDIYADGSDDGKILSSENIKKGIKGDILHELFCMN